LGATQYWKGHWLTRRGMHGFELTPGISFSADGPDPHLVIRLEGVVIVMIFLSIFTIEEYTFPDLGLIICGDPGGFQWEMLWAAAKIVKDKK
jgi:hypothetical protein